jgi:hydrogenase maturation protein HypF
MSRGNAGGAAGYTFAIDFDGEPAVVDPGPVLRAIVLDARAGVAPGVIGARFHRAVANLIVELAEAQRDTSAAVALSGGVFQNALLLRLSLNSLRKHGFEVMTHRQVPPNDGGIALGQLLIGNAG